MSVRKKDSKSTGDTPRDITRNTPRNTERTYFDLQKIPVDLKCKNESQKNLVKLINENTITICAGRAGTGKTFIACAQALKLLKS